MHIYKTRYFAKKDCKSYEKVHKVDGGYAIFTPESWLLYKMQK